MARRRTWMLMGLSAALGLAALVVSLGTTVGREFWSRIPGLAPVPRLDEDPTQPSGAASLPERPADAAGVQTLFLAPGMDPQEMARLLDDATPATELMLGEAAEGDSPDTLPGIEEAYNTYEPVDLWLRKGHGSASEVGQEVVRCMDQFEDQLTTDCYWDLDVVVRNDPRRGESEVVALRHRVAPESANDFACHKMAECCTRARTRQPWPRPLRVQSEYLSFTARGCPTVPWTAPGDIDERIQYYQGLIAENLETLRTLRESYAADNDLDSFAYRHNTLMIQSALEHKQAMIERLERQRFGTHNRGQP